MKFGRFNLYHCMVFPNVVMFDYITEIKKIQKIGEWKLLCFWLSVNQKSLLTACVGRLRLLDTAALFWLKSKGAYLLRHIHTVSVFTLRSKFCFFVFPLSSICLLSYLSFMTHIRL